MRNLRQVEDDEGRRARLRSYGQNGPVRAFRRGKYGTMHSTIQSDKWFGVFNVEFGRLLTLDDAAYECPSSSQVSQSTRA